MKKLNVTLILLISIAAIACGGEAPVADAPESATTAAEAPAETTYDLRGVVVERDPVANTLKVNHEAIGDWMGAMTMSFPVRGTDVQSLPENGQAITATVHVAGSEFWLSDVAAAEAAPSATETTATETTAAE